MKHVRSLHVLKYLYGCSLFLLLSSKKQKKKKEKEIISINYIPVYFFLVVILCYLRVHEVRASLR